LKTIIDQWKVTMENDITLEDIADALADLTLEVKVLEAKVQRLSEFRDTAGYVPIYENGGKQ
jgi:predicted ArsR family transcriptional regulator